MDQYFTREGAPACLLGRATEIGWTGLQRKERSWGGGSSPVSGNHSSHKAGEKFFEITEEDAEYLFDQPNSRRAEDLEPGETWFQPVPTDIVLTRLTNVIEFYKSLD